MIADLLQDMLPIAYDAGLLPSEARGCTFSELYDVLASYQRRQARQADNDAWMVAHLMLASGNMPKGTRLEKLIRDLLGREPGTVPGQPDVGRREASEPDPELFVEWLAGYVTAHGGKDLRAKTQPVT